VEVQLPEEGSFSCLTADFYRMIEFEVRLAVSQTLGNSNTYSTQGLFQALFAGIQILDGITYATELELRASVDGLFVVDVFEPITVTVNGQERTAVTVYFRNDIDENDIELIFN
jgi:hypothetical protein